jgi:hypothetical protein
MGVICAPAWLCQVFETKNIGVVTTDNIQFEPRSCLPVILAETSYDFSQSVE